MFTIGDFARHGRVSVRMLRHYDAVGLLRPARVDPHTGYRHYAAEQLARLNRAIESEGHMSTQEVVLKKIPAVRIAELSAVAASFGPQDIGPVVGPLYEELCGRLEEAGLTSFGPAVAYYEDAGRGDGSVVVHAGTTVPEGTAAEGLLVHVLPGVEQAATVVHHGSMDGLLPTAQTLATWIDAHGYASAGYAREFYLECPEDRSKWVTELQEPVVRA